MKNSNTEGSSFHQIEQFIRLKTSSSKMYPAFDTLSKKCSPLKGITARKHDLKEKVRRTFALEESHSKKRVKNGGSHPSVMT